jgi:hypothetical protein
MTTAAVVLLVSTSLFHWHPHPGLACSIAIFSRPDAVVEVHHAVAETAFVHQPELGADLVGEGKCGFPVEHRFVHPPPIERSATCIDSWLRASNLPGNPSREAPWADGGDRVDETVLGCRPSGIDSARWRQEDSGQV